MRCSSRFVVWAFGVVALTAAPAQAQEIGARFGVAFSNIVFDPPDLLDTQARIGWLGGGFVTLLPKSRIGLQIEGLISQRTIRFESIVDDTLTYVEIPALARVGVYRGDALVVHALGGAAFNYLLKAQERFDGGDPEDVMNAFRPWELALVVGADARLNERWIVGVRYVYGLTQVYQESADFPATQRGFQITAGYRFK